MQLNKGVIEESENNESPQETKMVFLLSCNSFFYFVYSAYAFYIYDVHFIIINVCHLCHFCVL